MSKTMKYLLIALVVILILVVLLGNTYLGLTFLPKII